MALEIERKFLVANDNWRRYATRRRCIRQGYLMQNGRLSARVRIDDGGPASLTLKTLAPGIVRCEFEYSIPLDDAEQLLEAREGSVIAKVRHHVPAGDLVWEIDVFEGENSGLVVAEIELAHAEQRFERPTWLGTEITGVRRYYNADLARTPFSRWGGISEVILDQFIPRPARIE